MLEGLFRPAHLFVVLVIALLIFGPKRLPGLGKGIGDGIRALKHALNPSDSDDKISKDTDNSTNKSNAA